MPTTRMSGRPDELQLGGQLDHPAEGVAAVGKRQLPGQLPLAAVDGRVAARGLPAAVPNGSRAGAVYVPVGDDRASRSRGS